VECDVCDEPTASAFVKLQITGLQSNYADCDCESLNGTWFLPWDSIFAPCTWILIWDRFGTLTPKRCYPYDADDPDFTTYQSDELRVTLFDNGFGKLRIQVRVFVADGGYPDTWQEGSEGFYELVTDDDVPMDCREIEQDLEIPLDYVWVSTGGRDPACTMADATILFTMV
jgi:hypothetical protein